jgi:hypothetical protein
MTTYVWKTIRGIVIPVTWGEDGEVISIAIDTYQEERYRVAENVMGRQLRDLLRKRVWVEGKVKISKNRPLVIEVSDYKPDEPLIQEEPFWVQEPT